MAAPFYIVFAGVNGAGKSTFFQSQLWRTPDMPQRMARVNPDEILRDFGGDWRSASDAMRAGKIALEAIDGHFSRKRSFNQETTLSGRTALKNIKRAHDLGYRVFLYFIGVENAEIAVERIGHRVSVGGHDVDVADVRRRHRTSLANFAKALDYCEQALVFDNTVDFSCLALWSRGTLAWWGGASLAHNWLADAILDDDLWDRLN